MKGVNRGLALLLALMCGVLAAGDGEASDSCFYDVDSGIYPQGARESARIFFPCDLESKKEVPATTLSNGRGGDKERMYWLSELIAQAGMVVCTVNALDSSSEAGYEVAQKAAVGLLKHENLRLASPLKGKLGQYGLIGYSIGGAAAIGVASELGRQVKSCIALAPYDPAPTSGLTAATLILTGTDDSIAKPEMGISAYEALAPRTPKAYAAMVAATHFFWIGNDNPGSVDDYIIAWLKYWLEDDTSYTTLLTHPQPDMTDARLDAPPLSPSGNSAGGCR